jgi:ferredoxin/flavodoxin---NADP+ reductase
MAVCDRQEVLSVQHWNESLFSFTTTRDPGLRFENGHFVMIGLEVEGKPVLRAYSIVSPNYEEHLEFLSIKVQDGPLTSRLQHLEAGDEILVSRKATGTLVIHDLRPGKNLFLLGTGTGLAPFMSIIRDPETYERFEKVILVHGVRYRSELAYQYYLEKELPEHEYLGDLVREQLLYYPTVTRESFVHEGRITTLLETGRLTDDLGLSRIDPAADRVMLCGSPAMLKDLCALLDHRGFEVSPRTGVPGEYVIERAFVEQPGTT